jgi:hypothetical protein
VIGDEGGWEFGGDAAAASHSRHELGRPQKQGFLLITRSIKSSTEYKDWRLSEEEIGRGMNRVRRFST